MASEEESISGFGYLTIKPVIGDALSSQGDWPAALDAYRKGLSIAEALVAHDDANSDWKRDLMASHIKVGDALAQQGETHGALSAYRRSLTIADEIAGQDVNNAQWQVDVAESCIKISELPLSDSSGQSAYRQRGLNILRALLETGRLLPNQDDGTGWFKRAMQALSEDLPQH